MDILRGGVQLVGALGLFVTLIGCEVPEEPDGPTGDSDPVNSCGVAAGEYFNVDIGTLEVSPRIPTGEAWDIDGSYADPYLNVFVWSSTREEVVFEYGQSDSALNATVADLGADPALGVYLEPDEFLVILVADSDEFYDDDIGQIALAAEDLADNANCGWMTWTDGAGIVGLELNIVDDLAR